MNLLLNCFLFVLCTFSVSHGQIAEPICIDDMEDFKSNNWVCFKCFYAENTYALSNVLQQEIEDANGIFYFTGPNADNAMFSNLNTNQLPSPTYLYVKYYGYFPSALEQNMYVAPPLDNGEGPLKFLPNTPGFNWGEAVIEIDNNAPFPAPVDIGAIMLDHNEYFLIDKVIVLHEDLGQDFEAIRAKCPPKETTSTTTTEEITETTTSSTEPSTTPTSTSTSSSTTTTTEAPSAPFSCKEPGFFRGADCNTFHVCLFDKFGVFGNLMFHCPPPQVWCQDGWRCEDPQFCHCAM